MEIFTPKAIAMGLPFMGQTLANKTHHDGNFTMAELEVMISDIFNETRKRPEMFTYRNEYDGFLNKVPNKRTRRSKKIEKKFFKYII